MSNQCNDTGGKWPSQSPFNGGPFPTKTWTNYIPPCPDYNKYTTEQLNMRRKAEVLKHKQNKTNDNKKARYAYFARNRNTRLLGSAEANSKSSDCKIPSSASDVPGKQKLFLDKSVPVFGLVNTRNYGNNHGGYPLKPRRLPINFTSSTTSSTTTITLDTIRFV